MAGATALRRRLAGARPGRQAIRWLTLRQAALSGPVDLSEPYHRRQRSGRRLVIRPRGSAPDGEGKRARRMSLPSASSSAPIGSRHLGQRASGSWDGCAAARRCGDCRLGDDPARGQRPAGDLHPLGLPPAAAWLLPRRPAQPLIPSANCVMSTGVCATDVDDPGGGSRRPKPVAITVT